MSLIDGGPCPHDADYQWSTIPGPCRGRLHRVGDGAYRCDGCRVTWSEPRGANPQREFISQAPDRKPSP